MKPCREVSNCRSLKAVADLVNGHDNPEWIAGTWAYQAAAEAGYGVTPENLRGHLEFLSAEGASFDEGQAVEAALAIHARVGEEAAYNYDGKTWFMDWGTASVDLLKPPAGRLNELGLM